MTLTPALFLDRDGVIIENCETYIRSWEDVHFLPQALVALARIRECAYKIIIVSNQSVVGRGIITLETAVFFKAAMNLDYADVEPRLAVSREVFSGSGYQQVNQWLAENNLLDQEPTGGNSCGVG